MAQCWYWSAYNSLIKLGKNKLTKALFLTVFFCFTKSQNLFAGQLTIPTELDLEICYYSTGTKIYSNYKNDNVSMAMTKTTDYSYAVWMKFDLTSLPANANITSGYVLLNAYSQFGAGFTASGTVYFRTSDAWSIPSNYTDGSNKFGTLNSVTGTSWGSLSSNSYGGVDYNLPLSGTAMSQISTEKAGDGKITLMVKGGTTNFLSINTNPSGTTPKLIINYSTVPVTGVSATNMRDANSNRVIQLNWTNPADPNFIKSHIRWSTTGYPTSVTDGNFLYEGSDVSAQHVGVSNGVTYYYSVFTQDSSLAWSSAVNISKTYADYSPMPSTGTSVVGNYVTANVTWTNSSESNFNQVEIRRKIGSFPDRSTGDVIYLGPGAGIGAKNTITDTGVPAGPLFCYSFFTQDTSNNWGSAAFAAITHPNDYDYDGLPNANDGVPSQNSVLEYMSGSSLDWIVAPNKSALIRSGSVILNGDGGQVATLNIGSRAGEAGTLVLNGTVTANSFKQGPGTSSITGTGTLKAGAVKGALSWSTRTLKPLDSSKKLSVGGNYTQTGGKLELNITKLDNMQSVSVTGNVQLGGALKINVGADALSDKKISFPIFSATGTYSGGFSSFDFPAAYPTFRWNASTITLNGTLTHDFDPYYWTGVSNPILCGSDFLVNDSGANHQSYPKVAALSNNGFAVTYVSSTTGSQGDIVMKVYNKSGDVVKTETLVNDYDGPSAGLTWPDIAPLKNGGFVIVWQSWESSIWRVRARIYENDGTPRTASFLVNAAINCESYNKVIGTNDGGFIVEWNYYDSTKEVIVKKYDLNGNALTTEKQVSSINITNYAQGITKFGNEKFLAVWSGNAISGTNLYIMGQFLDKDLNKIGSQFQINTTGTLSWYPEAIDLGNNKLMVIWSQNNGNILSQVITDSGSKVGGEVQVNTISGWYEFPRFNKTNDGKIVAFYSWFADSVTPYTTRCRLFCRVYDPSTSSWGTEVEVGPGPSYYSSRVHGDINQQGTMFVTYFDSSTPPRDGDSEGVYGRLVAVGQILDSDHDGVGDLLDAFPDNSLASVQPAASTMPPVTSSLALWMDAKKPVDASNTLDVLDTLSRYWLDFSGVMNNMDQSISGQQALYKSNAITTRNAMVFDGLNDQYNGKKAISANAAYTLACVYNADNLTFGSGQSYTLFAIGKSVPASGIRVGINSSQALEINVNTSTATGFEDTFTVAGMGTGTHIILIDFSGTTLRVFDNGFLKGTFTTNPLNLTSGSSPSIAADNSSGVYSHFFKGSMGDILAYTTQLTNSQLYNLTYFLSTRWGLTSITDSDQDGLTDVYDGKPTDNSVLEYQVASVSPFPWVPALNKTVTIKSGTVQVNSNTSVPTLNIGTTAGLTGILENNAVITINSVTLGPGTAAIRGNGTSKIASVNSSLVWEQGTLRLQDNKNKLTVNGNYTQTGGTLAINVTSEITSNRLVVNGNATLGGALQLTFNPNLIDDAVQSFPVMTVSGTYSGGFSSTAFPTAYTTYRWNTSTITANGTLSQVMDPLYWSEISGFSTITNEFLVNDVGTKGQTTPRVAALSNGNFAVVFTSYPGDFGAYDIKMKVYDKMGDVIKYETLVQDLNVQSTCPDVVDLKGGGFVVTWLSYESGVGRVRARIYENDGTARTSSFLVNGATNASGQFVTFQVEASNDGGGVVVWNYPTSGTKDIRARKYNKNGVAQTSETQISSQNQNNAAQGIARYGTDKYLITWGGYAGTGTTYYVWGQYVNESLTKIGGQFQINTTAGINGLGQGFVLPVESVDLGNGKMLAVWSKPNGGGLGYQILNGDGTKSGSEGVINSAAGYFDIVKLRKLNNGKIIAAYSQNGNGSYRVFGRIFTPGTTSITAVTEQQFGPTSGSGCSGVPAVAINKYGGTMVVYYDLSVLLSKPSRDGDSYGIYGQIVQTGFGRDSDRDLYMDSIDYFPEDPDYYQRPSVVVNPPITSGLKMWLDAQNPMGSLSPPYLNSNLKYWCDFNGNKTFMFQKTTSKRAKYKTNAISTLNAMVFDGTDDGYQSSTNVTLSSGFGIAMVYNGDNLTFGSGEQYALFSVGQAYPASGIRVGINNLQQLTVSVNTNSDAAFDDGIKSSGAGTGTHIIYIDFDGSTMSVYDNAVLVGSKTIGAVLNNVLGSKPFVGMDCINGIFGNYFKGSMGDILVYNRQLNQIERLNIINFLATRWNRSTQIDSDQDGLVDAYDAQPLDGTILEYQVASVSPYTWVPAPGKMY